MRIQSRLCTKKLPGHNPDMIGHGYLAPLKPSSDRLSPVMHKSVYQPIASSQPNSGTNPDIIRTYPDMVLFGLDVGLSQRQVCSPYPGSGIDISGMPPMHPSETQWAQKSSPNTPVLHITPLIFQNTLPPPSFNSPNQGGNLDINGGVISSPTEPQQVTSSAVHTAVLHIVSETQNIGAHRRQHPALRVRDRSGKPAFNSLESVAIGNTAGRNSQLVNHG